jgi:hypothetical protein
MELFILFYSFEIYAAILIIYLATQIFRKKKLPRKILVVDGIFLLIFFSLRILLNKYHIFLAGNFKRESLDWGTGLSNVGAYLINFSILLFLFLISQIVFWYNFNKQFARLNSSENEKSIWD